MMMGPKDRKPELNPGNDWEQDLESVRSALSGLEPVEPPDLLDQAVRNTVRRELAASRPKFMRWSRRWVGAFATAAVVVLTLSIVVQQDQKTTDPRSGDGIKLDAASNVAAAPPTEADSAAKTPMKQVREKSVYRPADEPDLAESREHFEDESLDMPVASTRDADAEEEPDRATQAGTFRVESSLLEKVEDVNDEITLAPDAWIEYMLELQKNELYEELKAELEAFRKAYPAYPIPSELRD